MGYVHNDRIIVSTNVVFFINWFEEVPKKVRDNVRQKLPNIKKGTKKEVTSHLRKHRVGEVGGVDKGIYKKNIAIRTLDVSPNHIKFTVGGEKGHYRLSHLLEHGHRIVRKGVVYGHTRKVPHISYGQDYANDKVVKMYKTAIDYALSTGNNPNWKGNK